MAIYIILLILFAYALIHFFITVIWPELSVRRARDKFYESIYNRIIETYENRPFSKTSKEIINLAIYYMEEKAKFWKMTIEEQFQNQHLIVIKVLLEALDASGNNAKKLQDIKFAFSNFSLQGWKLSNDVWKEKIDAFFESVTLFSKTDNDINNGLPPCESFENIDQLHNNGKNIQIDFGSSTEVLYFSWEELALFAVSRASDSAKIHFILFEKNAPNIAKNPSAFLLFFISFDVALHTYGALAIPRLEVSREIIDEILKYAVRGILDIKSESKNLWHPDTSEYFITYIKKYWHVLIKCFESIKSNDKSDLFNDPSNMLLTDIWLAYKLPDDELYQIEIGMILQEHIARILKLYSESKIIKIH